MSVLLGGLGGRSVALGGYAAPTPSYAAPLQSCSAPAQTYAAPVHTCAAPVQTAQVAQVQTQQIRSTVETQRQAVPRITMVPRKSVTMTQTMETQMQAQPRTVMTTQERTTMRSDMETVESKVPGDRQQGLNGRFVKKANTESKAVIMARLRAKRSADRQQDTLGVQNVVRSQATDSDASGASLSKQILKQYTAVSPDGALHAVIAKSDAESTSASSQSDINAQQEGEQNHFYEIIERAANIASLCDDVRKLQHEFSSEADLQQQKGEERDRSLLKEISTRDAEIASLKAQADVQQQEFEEREQSLSNQISMRDAEINSLEEDVRSMRKTVVEEPPTKKRKVITALEEVPESSIMFFAIESMVMDWKAGLFPETYQ